MSRLLTARSDASIAVILPCYNEAATIAEVVHSFRRALPRADIYVYDNNSSDDTRRVAAEAGAIVRRETRQGKGHVVRRMFADVEADAYVLVDGDSTYDASMAPALVDQLFDDRLDMVVAARAADTEAAFRPGHTFGNKALTGTIRMLFGTDLKDLLSGYRVFSKRFAKSFPGTAAGFEIETELTVYAMEISAPMVEVETRYFSRPENSSSKLKTFRDGFAILFTIMRLFQQERPLTSFGTLGCLLLLISVAFFLPILHEYETTGLVPRFPTLIAVGTLGLAGLGSTALGLVLSNICQSRRELRRLFYLSRSSRL